MYSWQELNEINFSLNSQDFKSEELELRLVDTNIGVQSSTYSMYSHPRDSLDLNESNLQDLKNLSSLIQEVIT